MISGAPYLPKRFDLDAMRDNANKFLGTLRNLYSFFAMYAEIDGFEPVGDVKSDNLIDRWILSRYNSTVHDVTAALDEYEITRAARAIQTFVIDELSNWYLRRCRRRFWKNEMSDDKLAAYETFYTVLEGVTRLAAPFVPFLTEAIWQRLRGEAGKSGSVHLELFPVSDGSMIDEELEKNMAGVLKAVTTGRAVRNKAAIKVRTPLARMLVHGKYHDVTEWTRDEEFAGLVLDELNVKAIETIDDTGELIRMSVKPEYSVLGKRFGKNMKVAASVLEGLGAESVVELVEKGQVSVEIDGKKESISLEEVKVESETADGFESESEGDLTVILDTKLTDELRREGLARDLVNRIQNFRKESGFEVSNRIKLAWRGPDEIKQVFEEYRDHICSETLVDNLHEGEQDWKNSTSFDLDGFQIDLWVRLA
jgi:isoleucyl-tRNA synthetase